MRHRAGIICPFFLRNTFKQPISRNRRACASKIPNTSALVAFEAAARHESFTRRPRKSGADAEVMCRQIAGLERNSWRAAVRRTRRGIELTGRRLPTARRESRPGSTRMDADTGHDGQQGQRRHLELAVCLALATDGYIAARWRPSCAEHPGITVNLAADPSFLFDDTEFDAAIILARPAGQAPKRIS